MCAATGSIKESIYLCDVLRHILLPQAEISNPSKCNVLYADNKATTAIAHTVMHCETTRYVAIAQSFLQSWEWYCELYGLLY